MAYIGNTAQTQAFTPAIDYFSGNGSATAFTLSRPVFSTAQIQVVVENVAQNPSDAFTVNGNTITFTSAPPSGTNNIYVYYTSLITQLNQPGQGTVGTAQIQNGAVIPADLSTGAPFWNTSGNVGIGTSNPQNPLEIYSATDGVPLNVRSGQSATYIEIQNSNNTSAFIGYNSSNSMQFWTDGTQQAVISGTGNVGIGTSSPATVLHTNSNNAGTPTTTGSATTGVSTRFQNQSVNFDFGTYSSGACFIQPRLSGDNSTNFNLILNPNGGNVGINNANPGVKLDIGGTSGTLVRVGSNSGSGTNNFFPMIVGDGDSGTGGTSFVRIGRFSNGTAGIDAFQSGVGSGPLGFGTFGTERMRIDANGMVLPSANNTYDLGSTSFRWRNIYTNDLHLSNGIGDYTIVEGEDELFLYNNKKGKVYKFALIEVDPSEAPAKAKAD